MIIFLLTKPVLYIIRLMTRLIASKWYYKEYEDLAMDWVEDQFAERAADTWRRVTAVTKRTATTSGIGPNSVLYRSLRDISSKIFPSLLVRETSNPEVYNSEFWFWVALGRSRDAQREKQQAEQRVRHDPCV